MLTQPKKIAIIELDVEDKSGDIVEEESLAAMYYLRNLPEDVYVLVIAEEDCISDEMIEDGLKKAGIWNDRITPRRTEVEPDEIRYTLFSTYGNHITLETFIISTCYGATNLISQGKCELWDEMHEGVHYNDTLKPIAMVELIVDEKGGVLETGCQTSLEFLRNIPEGTDVMAFANGEHVTEESITQSLKDIEAWSDRVTVKCIDTTPEAVRNEIRTTYSNKNRITDLICSSSQGSKIFLCEGDVDKCSNLFRY